MLALTLFLGCGAPADTDGSDLLAPPECEEPLGLELVASFDAAALAGADGPGYHDNRGPGIALADLTGDGWLDAYVASPIGASVVLVNDGAGRLGVDSTAHEGPRPLPRGNAVAATDLDGDGDADLAVGSERGQLDHLLYNEGGLSFRRVDLPESGGETKTVTFGDADGDGDLDLFAAGFTHDPVAGLIEEGLQRGDGNFLWLQQPDGTFAKADGAIPEEAVDALTYHGAFVDADADGDADLFLSDDWGYYVTPNLLLLNDGSGRFTVAEDCFCDHEMAGMGLAIGDSDGDAFPDLFLSDVGDVWLLRGTGEGWYVDAGASAAVRPERQELGASWGSVFTDLDQDGWDEIAVTYGIILPEDAREDVPDYEADALLHASGDGTYEDWSSRLGFDHPLRGRAVVSGDLDRDGRPDLVTAGILYVEQWRTTGGCGPGVTLRVSGPPGNPEGIGATITVDLPDRSYTRWLWPSGTYSSSSRELSLGLHGRRGADRITVTMPDGATASAEDVRAGTTLTLTPQ
jgi:hypothetical protein